MHSIHRCSVSLPPALGVFASQSIAMPYYSQSAAVQTAPGTCTTFGLALATTFFVAAATFLLTSDASASALYTALAAVKPCTPVTVRTPTRALGAPRQQPQASVTPAQPSEAGGPEDLPQGAFAPVDVATVPSATGNRLLEGSALALLLATLSAMGAALGYRRKAIAIAGVGGALPAKKGGPAQGGQAGAGYKGSTVAGSAPATREGKQGYVYKLGLKNGLGNVDEYSPIYYTCDWKSDGDVYEAGPVGLLLWAATFLAVLGISGFVIYSTSQL